MKVCIYARVSTESQELEQQIAACRRYCEYKEYEIGAVYQEIVSGAKAKRPEYARMITALRNREYEGVVVFRIDRLGRNARELALTVDELEGKGIKVLSVSENFDTSTALGRAMRELIYIFAQLEREQLQEATRHRLNALKNLGVKLGRRKGSKDKKPRRKAGYLLRYAGKKAKENYLNKSGGI
jgi:site-specific DNA recombinase